ncbi:hypothetical protein [Fuscibacter oryzae]|uniref:Uncharacterized protein n=1 Tax=Fuscibacter oryzae TaxID=2803939 RepID=A0A8J7MTK2_9RHOB|nr:hypothetical protein [Fuscibacter oryzae]MBL4929336.1 hypothetical protein [Fuscibacter oryzae]
MKVELLNPIMIDGVAHKAGATVTVEDALGRNLVYREKAIEAASEGGEAAEGKTGKAAK